MMSSGNKMSLRVLWKGILFNLEDLWDNFHTVSLGDFVI